MQILGMSSPLINKSLKYNVSKSSPLPSPCPGISWSPAVGKVVGAFSLFWLIARGSRKGLTWGEGHSSKTPQAFEAHQLHMCLLYCGLLSYSINNHPPNAAALPLQGKNSSPLAAGSTLFLWALRGTGSVTTTQQLYSSSVPSTLLHITYPETTESTVPTLPKNPIIALLSSD